jgi:hypothetical protein
LLHRWDVGRYMPTAEDVGSFLAVSATPLWRGSPCAAPVVLHLAQVSFCRYRFSLLVT